MNVKRFVLACLAVFVFIVLYEWGFHGVLLKDNYAPPIWRPQPPLLGWLLLGQFVIAFTFCLIYTRSETIKQGVGFAIGYGLVIALMRSGNDLITYAVQPLPFSLIGSWIVGSIVEGIIAGALLGAIYRAGPEPAPAPGP
jgi:hypothetical protein